MVALRDVHYGWVVVAAGTLAVFACIGIGRFALGMLLPPMGADLGLTYAEMGFVSSGNLVGYTIAVMAAGWLSRRFGSRLLIVVGLVTVAASMMAISLTHGFQGLLPLYVITGLGSGAANVPVMALVSFWFARRHRGKAAGLIVSGNGFAIILSGALVPAFAAGGASDGWRGAWLALGAIVLAVAAVCWLLVRHRPEEHDLAPFGGADRGAHAAGAGGDAEADRRAGALRRRTLAHLGAIYFLFGASYVIYATFIVTSLIDDHGFPDATAGAFWSWLGILSLVSGPVFGSLSDIIGRRAGLMVVFALHMAAYGLASAPLSDAFLFLSIALFGIAAWSIPSIMAAAVGDYMGADHAAAGFGTITVVFGIGQIVGPAIAGLAADAAGGFAVSFALAAALAAVAIVLSGFLHQPPPS
ncbi:MAG: MFS transporter [Rhodospirillales bacterium]|nr:MFS transporter [Rhodospirillales bacterium]